MSIVGNKVIKEDEKLFKGFVLNPPFDPTTKVNRFEVDRVKPWISARINLGSGEGCLQKSNSIIP